MMDTIVQWATILSPIIAVVIAIWASRSSAKDTAQKITALENNTKKQIDSIKDLSKIQIKTTQIQINKELKDALIRHKQTSNRIQEENTNEVFNYLGSSFDSIRQKDDKKRDLSDNKDYYYQRIKWLENNLAQLNELEKKLGKA